MPATRRRLHQEGQVAGITRHVGHLAKTLRCRVRRLRQAQSFWQLAGALGRLLLGVVVTQHRAFALE